VGYYVAQCNGAGQVLARGGSLPNTGNCVRAQSQALMSATPVMSTQDGRLEIKSLEGQDYLKVYDPSLSSTRWQPLLQHSGILEDDMATILLPKGLDPLENTILAHSPQEEVVSGDVGNRDIVQPELGGMPSINQPITADQANNGPATLSPTEQGGKSVEAEAVDSQRLSSSGASSRLLRLLVIVLVPNTIAFMLWCY